MGCGPRPLAQQVQSGGATQSFAVDRDGRGHAVPLLARRRCPIL
jgi:hypothetical protein